MPKRVGSTIIILYICVLKGNVHIGCPDFRKMTKFVPLHLDFIRFVSTPHLYNIYLQATDKRPLLL